MNQQKAIINVSQLLLQAQGQDTTANHKTTPIELSAQLLAQGNFKKAEQVLLAHANQASSKEQEADMLWILSQVYIHQSNLKSCINLSRRISALTCPDDRRVLHLVLQISRLRRDPRTRPFGTNLKYATRGEFPHLDFEIIAILLQQGDLEEARIALALSGNQESCEAILLQSQILYTSGERIAAEELLFAHWSRYRQRLDYCIQYVEYLFELRRGNTCLPVLKQAVEQHLHLASPLYERFAQARMLQRQPGVALRLKLLERLPRQIGKITSLPTILAAIYDSLGRSDWLTYLCKYVEEFPSLYIDLHSNRLMHLSSHESSLYPQACRSVIRLIDQTIAKQLQPFTRPLKRNHPQRMRIGWICADIANHPVARFLLSWLAAPQGNFEHEHLVIGTVPGQTRYEQLFRELSQVQFVDQSMPNPLHKRIEQLRQLDLDIAIDLNGWTGNHIAPAFIARIAPIQLNYLAYHASTGIPAMDTWVVDHQVLPAEPQCEWHTEQLLRLDRPFLAWQPHPALPEAAAVITQPDFAPTSEIRFGCFNHLRKISDEALHCWARILTALPTARMVLKAHSADDSATATLLQRRLERSGLPLQQVIWLPYTATPDEHLKQYAQMDVALDSFPNTGCTTTCEALWMGVPVITLQGNHYVSRMASAVLDGAGLQEWICTSTAGYEELAVNQADPPRLAWLRQNRNHWRRQLQQSPLGDARDLMQNLESAFTALAQRRLEEQALQMLADSSGLV